MTDNSRDGERPTNRRKNSAPGIGRVKALVSDARRRLEIQRALLDRLLAEVNAAEGDIVSVLRQAEDPDIAPSRRAALSEMIADFVKRFRDLEALAPASGAPVWQALEQRGMSRAEIVVLLDGKRERPSITMAAGELARAATEAETALIAAGASIYQRGGALVRPIAEQARASKGRSTTVVRLRELTPDMMRDLLAGAASFQQWDGRSKTFRPIDPPLDVCRTILARDGFWRSPILAGVITTPTLRPDGSILAEPGYDPITRLLLVDPPRMPEIPDRPTQDDADEALDLIDQLFEEFPFVGAVDRSVALSAFLTLMLRPAMDFAPLHCATAPAAGTGKTYLFDLLSVAATGDIAPVIAIGRTEEETEKRLGAEVMEGSSIIVIDNVNGGLSGDFLCQTVSAAWLKPRVLGKSQNVRVPNAWSILANGNNIKIIGDLTRRALLCQLDANMERPELRCFASDPIARLLEARGRYVAAALTIARAYLCAGFPVVCPPLAGFRDWSRFVRGPLVWLGRADPADSVEITRGGDPDITNLRAVLAAWLATIGIEKPLTVGALRDAAHAAGQDDFFRAAELQRALLAVAAPPGRNEIDARRLGQWLTRMRDRIVDGLKIESRTNAHSKQQEWWISGRRPDPLA
jgi:putative DNA primase/helicase